MKKTNLLIVAILLFFGLNAQEQREKVTWDYPAKPGTEEWKKLWESVKSYDEMVKICQIPEEILVSLSTEELTDICLQYPFLGVMFAFNFIDHGIDAVFRKFNGIRELYKREDMAQYLIKRYDQKIQEISLLDENNPDFKQGDFLIPLSAIEILLGLVDKQDNEGYKNILQSLVKGYEAKSKHGYFSGFGIDHNFYARGNIISKIDHPLVNKLSQQEKSASLLNSGAGGGDHILINKLSYELIK